MDGRRRTYALLAASAGIALVLPATAAAQIGLPPIPGIPGPSLPSAGDLVRPVVDALFDLLFGDIPERITGDVLKWLLTHPEFGEGARFDKLEQGAAVMRDIAYGLAVAFFCAGVARRAFDDVAGGAVDATRRFVLAVAGITVWPWAFELAVRFSNVATEAFLQVPHLSHASVALLSFAFISPAAMGIGFICGLVGAILLIALFLEKVIVLTGLTAIYVLMPVLIAASPFPPTSHLLGIGAAGLTAILLVNPIWTALLAVFALVGEGVLVTGAAAIEDFIEPLLAIAMLVLVVGSLPLLLRLAWVRGLAAALMTPTTGAHHAGGSSLASAITLANGARGARALLEQRSADRMQSSAWQAEGPGLASSSPPVLSGAGTTAGQGPLDRGAIRDDATRSLDAASTPSAPGLASRPTETTERDHPRLFSVDRIPVAERRRAGERRPDDQLRLPIDERRHER